MLDIPIVFLFIYGFFKFIEWQGRRIDKYAEEKTEALRRLLQS